MATSTTDYGMYRGDSATLQISIVDEEDGADLDVSTARAITWVMVKAVDESVLLTKTLGSGLSVSGNIVRVTLLPADTASLSPHAGFGHELEITDAFARVFTALQGTVQIMRDYIQ